MILPQDLLEDWRHEREERLSSSVSWYQQLSTRFLRMWYAYHNWYANHCLPGGNKKSKYKKMQIKKKNETSHIYLLICSIADNSI
jgi:hypothetical protein